MADANSAPYESVKNRRSRAPNKRPYDSFAEGTVEQNPPKIHQRETQTPPAPQPEQNLLANLQRVENERRDLLRGIIGKLNRASLEELLVDAGLDHKTVMTSVIAANTKPHNWRDDGHVEINGISQGYLRVSERPAANTEAPKGAVSRSDVATFVARYQQHDLVTPPTEPRPYTTPYPPLAQVTAPVAPLSTSPPKSRKKAKTDQFVNAAAPSPPKSRTKGKRQAAATPTGSAPKAKSKPTRPYSTKKFPGRGPGRWARGTTKEDEGTPKTTASGRPVRSKKYTEPETEDEEEESESEDGDSTEVEEEIPDVTVTPSKRTKATAVDAAKPKVVKAKRTKNPADKNKEQTMIPVGILAGNSNVALAGFDRRMGLIFRTSRYNRDGEFIGLGEGNSRSIKRDKVDFHPVLASLNEEELRTEILRRQQKIGYQPPPGRDISGAPSGRRVTTGGMSRLAQ